jgi:hypothetical protein
MKSLIYVIPGLLCNVKESPFVKLIQEGDSNYDILIHNAYHLIQTNGRSELVHFFEDIINKLPYKNIFLVSHSSGSDLVLQARLKNTVKAVVFWSPSMMFPQNISATLPKRDGLLYLSDTLCISERLGHDFDTLNTRPLLEKFKLPHTTFFTQDEPHDSEWGTINTVPYEHNYTQEQMVTLLHRAKVWFQSI